MRLTAWSVRSQTAAPGPENYSCFLSLADERNEMVRLGSRLLRCEKITAAAQVSWFHAVVIQHEDFCITYVGMHMHGIVGIGAYLKMKTARTLILSSAAGLIALSGGTQKRPTFRSRPKR